MVPIRYNVRSLLVRKATTLATAIGIGLVVFVLAGSLMLNSGIDRALGGSGQPDQVLVIRKGSDAELNSNIDDAKVGALLASPGVARTPEGKPAGGGEVVTVAAMPNAVDGGISNVLLRGMSDQGVALRRGFKVIEGRAAQPGAPEAIVGKRLKGRFPGLEVGGKFELRKGRNVDVVGVFEDDGSSAESEVWVDFDSLRQAFGRAGVVSTVRARLESPSRFDAFKANVESDKSLGFQALTEREYYDKQSQGLRIFVTGMGTTIAFFFSLGAMVGAMITMYGSIASRQREIGTLRALGFSRRSILLAFLLESTALALLGGALGLVAALTLGGTSFSLINFATFSEVSFSFKPTAPVLASAMVAAGVMGVIGGFFPALRAAFTSPVKAMRG